jgi:hypothetical protein
MVRTQEPAPLRLATHLLSGLGSETAAAAPFDSVRVYILVCDWVPARKTNAAALCDSLAAAGVACALVPALRGDELSEADLTALEAEGVITRAWEDALPKAGEAALRSALPRALHPLLPEHLPNQLNASHNWRANRAAGNTVGAIRCAQAMAADAAAVAAAAADAAQRADAPAGGGDAATHVRAVGGADSTVWVYLEDDAVLSDTARFATRLLAAANSLGASSWDLLSLAPPPHMCERAAALPWPLRCGRGCSLAPRYSFSRTTGVAFSAAGVRALLAAQPANNVIDMWIRQLMRAGKLRVRIHCDDLVTYGEVAKTQARRALVEWGGEPLAE